MSKTYKTPKGTELPVLNLKGKDYLQVMHRLVWFREERPSWSIETEIISVSDKQCLARAVIRDEAGRVIATSHKTETLQGFPDFVEKSETGAVGRALALCGFGTQFCADELDEGARLADSPAPRSGVHPQQPAPGDGDTVPTAYKIPFGKWAQRSLEEVFNNHGGQAIESYIQFLEDAATKNNKTMSNDAVEFISQAERFLAAMEKGWAKAAGSRV